LIRKIKPKRDAPAGVESHDSANKKECNDVGDNIDRKDNIDSVDYIESEDSCSIVKNGRFAALISQNYDFMDHGTITKASKTKSAKLE
jgi:hypothetical protein